MTLEPAALTAIPSESFGAPVPYSAQATSDEQLIRLWLHGRPETTMRAYTADIENFRTFVAKPLRGVTIGDLQEFADTLEHLSNASRARRLSAVKSLLSFGHRIGYLTFDVGRPLRLPKVRNDIAQRILTEEQVLAMITSEPNARKKVLLRLLYSAGLRASEACALRWRDLHARNETGQLSIRGKGAKLRHVLLSQGTWEALTALRNGASDDAPIFASRKGGEALDTSQARRIVVNAAKRAKIRKAVSPHWLRHAHASHSLDRGCPPHVLQPTLGHGSLVTTTRYTHARPSDSSARYLVL